ncbi:MAG TPA: NAD(P)-binding domain-containing protein [Vicinamibacteria bacterium]|nr:NAD(P)-binding domain-containing protein [Vicinamibacteria bacterium]
MRERVGFLGLGVMGRPMAENLSKAFAVVGFDVQEARLAGLEKVERADSAGELARSCPVVCLSLPSAAVVEQVVLGPDGLAGTLREGALLIDLSTSLPSTSRRIAERLAPRGIAFADAPVSGGELGARSAALAIMVGAAAPTFERCKPYLSAMARSVVRVGEVGAGNIAKLVNNMIVGSAFAVIAEGFALAARNGLDPDTLYQAMREGWAGSRVLDVSGPAIAAGDYRPGGTIDMLQKDLSYARAVAMECDMPTPMTAAVLELLVAAQAAGHGARSQPALFELWRRPGGDGIAS